MTFPKGSPREVLTADRTYYVSPSGSDANSGLTGGAPLATIAAAIAKCYAIDSSGYAVKVQLADGAHAAANSVADVNRELVGGTRLEIIGNAGAPGNVVVQGGYPVTRFEGGCKVALRHLKLVSATTGSLILAREKSDVHIDNVIFGTCSRYHLEIVEGAAVRITSNYQIDAGALSHIYLAAGGTISGENRTGTLVGTLAFTSGFVRATVAGLYNVWNQTWTGSATGKRYDAKLNGVINTYGKGATHFPGDVAGTTATGGQYAHAYPHSSGSIRRYMSTTKELSHDARDARRSVA